MTSIGEHNTIDNSVWMDITELALVQRLTNTGPLSMAC